MLYLFFHSHPLEIGRKRLDASMLMKTQLQDYICDKRLFLTTFCFSLLVLTVDVVMQHFNIKKSIRKDLVTKHGNYHQI